MTDDTTTPPPIAEVLPPARPTHVSVYERRATPNAPATQIVRKLTVTRRVRRAIDEMIWSGAKRAEAAKVAGLTDHSLRAALRRPHVKSFYLAELDGLRNSERPRNIHALVAVRDEAKNGMARVSAAKTLEELSGATTGSQVNVNVGIAVAGYCLDLREDPK